MLFKILPSLFILDNCGAVTLVVLYFYFIPVSLNHFETLQVPKIEIRCLQHYIKKYLIMLFYVMDGFI